ERDPALAAADYQRIGLAHVTQFAQLVGPALQPVFPVPEHAMLDAFRATRAFELLKTLELRYRSEQGPAAVVLEPDVAATARDGGLENEPGADNSVRGFCFSLYSPVRWSRCRQRRPQHVVDRGLPFHRPDVPGEGDEVAPVAFVGKEIERAFDVAF